MTQTINDVMQNLNGAMCARKVYWAQHPSAVKPLQAAAALLTELLTARESIVVVGLQDRVIVGEDELGCSKELLNGLFAQLHSRGAQSLTFLRGVTVLELGKFLEQIATKDATGSLISSNCIRFGCLSGGSPAPQKRAKVIDPSAQVPRLKDLWIGLMHKGVLDRALLDTTAHAIRGVSDDASGSTMLLAGLQTHEDYTFVHTSNVAILSAGLGDVLGLSEALVHDLTIAALLHDVGKRRVPKEVLNKSTALSTSEFSIVERHPSDGAAMLFGIKELPAIAAIVAYEHHMHPDGTGYPRIKIGRQMQLASQIVQIADVYDALRSNRPFRPGLTFDEARALMYKDIRRYYEPELLNTFFGRVAVRAQHLDSDESTRPDSSKPGSRAA